MVENGIGASLARKEDVRFLTGKGNYTDDINRPGQTYAYLVRSPHAHATINSVDIAAAKTAPGVVGVFVGQDLLDDAVGGLICGASVTGKGGEVNKVPPRNVLTMDKARFVGDPIVVVIAETLAQAKDGAEMVAIDYTELPSTVSTSGADADGAP